MGWGLSPPLADPRAKAGLSGEGVLFRPHAVSAPRVVQRDRGCRREGRAGSQARSPAGRSGLSGLRGQRGLREDLPVWVCFSSPLRWRPGSPRLACCSGPRWVRRRRRLRLPTPPPRAAPSFSGPVTCRPETPRLLKGKNPSERSERPASTDREGYPPSAAPRPPGLPKPRQPRRKPRRCHHSALGQALPLSSCNHRGRLRPRGGV